MHFPTPVSLAVTAIVLANSALSQSLNDTQEYYLRTELKPGQSGKDQYNNLYLTSYHTGAGLSDAVLDDVKPVNVKGYLEPTNVTMSNGSVYSHQNFDLGNSYPYTMSIADVAFYAAWEPVRINIGDGSSDLFFINSTGLQYAPNAGQNITDAFGGWLVCDWWHGTPQLFMKWSYYDDENPSSCADVNLIPEYI